MIQSVNLELNAEFDAERDQTFPSTDGHTTDGHSDERLCGRR
jgi:hypothetical protein